MTTEKMVNYTEAQTKELVERYQAGETVETLAETMGKTTRSIVAKLSREGVYKTTKRVAEHRVKKAELVEQLASACGVAPELFDSLEKANHEVLVQLVSRLR